MFKKFFSFFSNSGTGDHYDENGSYIGSSFSNPHDNSASVYDANGNYVGERVGSFLYASEPKKSGVVESFGDVGYYYSPYNERNTSKTEPYNRTLTLSEIREAAEEEVRAMYADENSEEY